jgi:BirA family biotin operon repressor/biotin-[acetyl-CoA-carboxylase] ligase
MNTLFTGHKSERLASVDSTNNYAAKLVHLSEWPDGSVIVAEAQTAGRGRRSKYWESEPGKNLLCSYIFYPHFLSAGKSFMLNMVASLAVRDLLLEFEIDSRIKWPNDVLTQHGKIAGILIESHVRGQFLTAAVIGIGLNVNQQIFTHPGCDALIKHQKAEVQLQKVLERLHSNLEARYLKLRTNPLSIAEEYNRHLFARGEVRTYNFSDGLYPATLIRVDDDGMALFRLNSGDRYCSLDEVTLIRDLS